MKAQGIQLLRDFGRRSVAMTAIAGAAIEPRRSGRSYKPRTSSAVADSVSNCASSAVRERSNSAIVAVSALPTASQTTFGGGPERNAC